MQRIWNCWNSAGFSSRRLMCRVSALCRPAGRPGPFRRRSWCRGHGGQGRWEWASSGVGGRGSGVGGQGSGVRGRGSGVGGQGSGVGDQGSGFGDQGTRRLRLRNGPPPTGDNLPHAAALCQWMGAVAGEHVGSGGDREQRGMPERGRAARTEQGGILPQFGIHSAAALPR